ncbi:trans-2,3-dihydro-3-hydroxyanthranilate isomerase [Rhizobium tibeticum]|uniref:Trans-2, 3-dihydro-3-hydroxyanthranilateisomerase n=1 Tax=Rhizobium tibeticum TaxID=501024 RepID=A0A1H8R3F0_9HYPH|nr:PhzF family phenazine biosynthesis protein [Rhizobium tibeticum]MDP9809948.1 trans-2,3-dihydro-3-hydroxyanthranilate isomerase [Rhizobium tibeticum]SEI05512.1 Trans-2, 3-dihydro-3-hydroxyanthranilateisomerase [Rhizobium tibeticum]SEO60811.1 trans-2,3-dihydro-3-hydroxyanthranilate isomerase [Rhizobium tibeticum]
MKTVAFTTVDVFTSARFEGNPLAVMTDARGLTDTDMQNIAAEFGYSEVTFVLPPEDPANTARIRIFTPTMEVPFAGHPNVGTAYVLGQQAHVFGRPVGDRLRFEEKAGLVEVDLKRNGNEVLSATIRAPKPLAIGDTVSEQIVARCIAIEPQDIRVAKHSPVVASVGLSFVVAELTDLAALGRARPNLAYFQDAAAPTAEGNHDFSLFVYLRSGQNPWTIRARMFAPLDNVPEDPATGSASAALGAYLVWLEPDANMSVSLTIEQGVEMGRRSIITIDVVKKDGIVTDVTISGSCAPVMRGEIAY